jgi:multimeric flavodoxin WrbA
MLEALLSGMTGAAITRITLAEKKLGYCTGCYSCWNTTPGKCIQEDDMAGILAAMQDADLLVFGSPLYFGHVSGLFKLFFDRLTAAGGDPHAARKAPGETRCVMVANCGYPIRSQFSLLSAWIHHVSGLMQIPLLAEFYTTNGKILTAPEEGQRPARERYLAYLTECGRHILQNGSLPDNLREQLEKNVLDF